MAWKRDSEYWMKRLQTEHPEIWAKHKRGEIASVRAAAIEAGMIRQRTGLMDLRRGWKNASVDERDLFLKEVGG